MIVKKVKEFSDLTWRGHKALGVSDYHTDYYTKNKGIKWIRKFPRQKYKETPHSQRLFSF